MQPFQSILMTKICETNVFCFIVQQHIAKMLFLDKSRKMHVTYGDSKRFITYSKGEEIKELRHHFLRVFSDVLSDDVAPANVKFQRYDDAFQDYEDLAHDVQLEDNVKLKAIVSQKRGKKVLHLNNLNKKKHPVFSNVTLSSCRGSPILFS